MHKINSVQELKTFLSNNFERKIKGIHCPSDWTFNDFWEFLKFSAKEDYKVLKKIEEDKQRKLALRSLSPRIDRFADAFSRVSPLIVKSASSIIAKKEREAQEQEQVSDDLDILLTK